MSKPVCGPARGRPIGRKHWKATGRRDGPGHCRHHPRRPGSKTSALALLARTLETRPLTARVQALIADMDGTLWRGEQALPGLVRVRHFFAAARHRLDGGHHTTVEMPDRYWQKRPGLAYRPAGSRFDRGRATAAYLQREWPPGRNGLYDRPGGWPRRCGPRLQAGPQRRRPVDLVVSRRHRPDLRQAQGRRPARPGGARFYGTNRPAGADEEGWCRKAARPGRHPGRYRRAPIIVGKPERLRSRWPWPVLGTPPARR